MIMESSTTLDHIRSRSLEGLKSRKLPIRYISDPEGLKAYQREWISQNSLRIIELTQEKYPTLGWLSFNG